VIISIAATTRSAKSAEAVYRHLPGGRADHERIGYKTRPWEMQYDDLHLTARMAAKHDVGVCAINEIHALEQPGFVGHQQDFLCEGLVLISRSIRSASSSHCCGAARSFLSCFMGRGGAGRGEQAEIFSIPLKNATDDRGPNRKRRMKRIICSSGWRAQTFGTNNVDHRTTDYTGLVTALGERANEQ